MENQLVAPCVCVCLTSDNRRLPVKTRFYLKPWKWKNLKFPLVTVDITIRVKIEQNYFAASIIRISSLAALHYSTYYLIKLIKKVRVTAEHGSYYNTCNEILLRNTILKERFGRGSSFFWLNARCVCFCKLVCVHECACVWVSHNFGNSVKM